MKAFTRSGTQQLVCIYFQCVYCFHSQMSFNRSRERASWESHSGARTRTHTPSPCCEFFESDAKKIASALVCVHIQRICCTSVAHRGIFSWMCADNVVDSHSAPLHFWHICVLIVKRNWKHNSRHHLRAPVIFTVRLDFLRQIRTQFFLKQLNKYGRIIGDWRVWDDSKMAQNKNEVFAVLQVLRKYNFKVNKWWKKSSFQPNFS